MSLPALRLSTSLSWPVLRDLVPRLREHLAGQVLALPAALGERELAEALDAVALLTAWPVRLLGSAEESGGDAVLLVP